MPPELNVVEMWSRTDAEDADHLVLTAIKRPLSGIGLVPHCDVEKCAIDVGASRDELADMAPIHRDEMHGTVS